MKVLAGQTAAAVFSWSDRVRAHLAIARIDHWVKNVFVLPGLVIPLSLDPPAFDRGFWLRLVLGFLSIGFIASSNYVINEVLDGPLDKLHPIKKHRPVPSGRVHIPAAYGQWIGLMIVGLALAWLVNAPFFITMAALWFMGCVYNSPPLRTKDVVYLDALTESINNPLRFLAGWYIAGTSLVPPLSLIASYWMVGCYFMGLKRFSEYREINDPDLAAAYRRSFRYYTERALLVSVMFYGAAAMLFYGAFIMRYRIELVLAFPLVAWVMAIYCDLAFEPHSAVQNPEYLYRQKPLMLAVVLCSVCMAALLFIDLPVFVNSFAPTLPLQRAAY